MNTYVTGSTIRQLREAKGLTQAELAGTLSVSAKTISKWETAKGLPDISLLEPLAAALGVSVLELMQGEPIINRNRAANLLRSKLYVCPLCGNVLHATGQAVVSCCGITLPPLDISEADDADEHHQLTLERVEDELFVTIHHPMTKDHYISFIACLTGDKLQLVKLYPEGDASCRFKITGADGIFGKATQAAVEQYQRDRGLPGTGVWDEKAQAAVTDATGEQAEELTESSVAQRLGEIALELAQIASQLS